MKYSKRTIFLLGFPFFLTLALSASVFAQEDRIERDNRPETSRERAEQLRQRADELRTRVFRSETQEDTIQSDEHATSTENKEIDKTILRQKVEEFNAANQELQQEPEALENQRTVLLFAIDSLLEYETLLRQRLDLFPVIQQTLKESIAAQIEADVAQLNIFQQEAHQAANEEELQQLAHDLQEYRREVTQTKTRKLILLAHAGVFEHRVLALASSRAERIDERIDEFEDMGKNVEPLEELLLQAENNINSTYQDLNVLKRDILENDIDMTFMDETRQTLNNIKGKIKETYSLFREIATAAQEF